MLQELLLGPQEPKRQLQVRVPVLRRVPVPGPVQERVLSCHKRPERLQQR